MDLVKAALEQRIERLHGRLQMFGDEPDLHREPVAEVAFYQLIEHLPGFRVEPAIAQVRISERWTLKADGSWRLGYYVYDYERFVGHPAGAGAFGYHLHPLASGGPPVTHAKVVDGRAGDPHYRTGAVDVDDAVDLFFRMDASGDRITPAGLAPLWHR